MYHLFAIILAVVISLLLSRYIITTAFNASERRRVKGKRCPECQAIVNAKRTKCRHCGHVFEQHKN